MWGVKIAHEEGVHRTKKKVSRAKRNGIARVKKAETGAAWRESKKTPRRGLRKKKKRKSVRSI